MNTEEGVESMRGLKIGGWLATLALMLLTASATARPNIIFVMADDLGPEFFGCYGGDVETPNLNRMAQEGMLFENAWCTPICSATRAMVMTGRGAYHTGWYHNSLKVNPVGERDKGNDWRLWGNRFYSEFIKEAGYRTAITGRWGIPISFDADRMKIDEYCIHVETEHSVPEGYTFTGLIEDPTGYGFGAFYSRYWHPAINRNGVLLDTKPADFGEDFYFQFALDFASRKSEEPFMIYMPLHLPHGTSVKKGNKLPSTPISGRVGMITGGDIEESVQYIDVLMGRLFEGLEKAGVLDNTIVIFGADNATTGRKTVAGGGGTRVPLLVTGPEKYVKPGVRTRALLSYADLLPTWLEWADGSLPDGYEIDGVSQAAVMAGCSQRAREFLTSYIGTARMITDGTWQLDAVDEIFSQPDGILYYIGTSTDGTTYRGYEERDPHNPDDPEASIAHQRLLGELQQAPWLDPRDPYVEKAIRKYAEKKFRHRLSFKHKLRDQYAPLNEAVFNK